MHAQVYKREPIAAQSLSSPPAVGRLGRCCLLPSIPPACLSQGGGLPLLAESYMRCLYTYLSHRQIDRGGYLT